ncbi:MAG: hypothetical protein JWR69_2159 [Pedosphaera sp.]|nr:hypothetical protein [Pedosphaera sp.]
MRCGGIALLFQSTRLVCRVADLCVTLIKMPPLFLASARFSTPELMFLFAAAILGLPAMFIVHCGLEYCYLVYARRFCRNNGLKLMRWKCWMAFDKSGVKTEFTIFELNWLDGQSQRKLVRLVIWIFGIRKVLSNENYPESQHEVPPAS